MSDLERISLAQLNSALTEQGLSSRKSLSNADSSILLAEVEVLTRRYPSQDHEESIAVYFQDLEQLALKYSVRKVQAALTELRIAPGQKFFPRPDEVAEVIEAQRERKLTPTVSDAQRYLAGLARWGKAHAEYMREREAEDATDAA